MLLLLLNKSVSLNGTNDRSIISLNWAVVHGIIVNGQRAR